MEEAILEQLRTQPWGVFKICAKRSHRSLSPYEEALQTCRQRNKHILRPEPVVARQRLRARPTRPARDARRAAVNLNPRAD